VLRLDKNMLQNGYSRINADFYSRMHFGFSGFYCGSLPLLSIAVLPNSFTFFPKRLYLSNVLLS
jgi:hypothetical protein